MSRSRAAICNTLAGGSKSMVKVFAATSPATRRTPGISASSFWIVRMQWSQEMFGDFTVIDAMTSSSAAALDRDDVDDLADHPLALGGVLARQHPRRARAQVTLEHHTLHPLERPLGRLDLVDHVDAVRILLHHL